MDDVVDDGVEREVGRLIHLFKLLGVVEQDMEKLVEEDGLYVDFLSCVFG